jgi:nucleoside-diphosphate-sugar epimerase
MSKLIIGCGYLGSRVARLWQDLGESVHAITRSSDNVARLVADGVLPTMANVCNPNSLAKLPQIETVLYAVGYDHSSPHSIQEVYAAGLANVLSALPNAVQRVIYISTTGVYGSASGEWVDENTPTDPQRDGGKASLAAEQVLAAHPIGKHSTILRLAGIYGPNRIPYIDKLRAGESLAVPSEGWLNLIHVYDAAAFVVAIDQWAAQNPRTDGPAVFCLSDGHPVVRGDYYREVARHIGAADLHFIAPDPNSPAAQRARSDKRISNRKLLETLNYKFQYPDYRAGLAAILRDSV